MRRERLEAQFLNLLDLLKPKPAAVKLFRQIVLDVWKRRHTENARFKATLENRLVDLARRESILDNAYLFDRKIDQQTYERTRDHLREEIAIARVELETTTSDEPDVEGLLSFALHVITNAPRLWLESDLEERQAIQRVLFPDGLRFKDGAFGTAVTSLAFSGLEPNLNREMSFLTEG